MAQTRDILDALPQILWATRPDGYHDFYNARWYEFTGVPAGTTDGDGWKALFHPDDQPLASKRWQHSLETGAPYEIEYRLRRHDGVYCWVLGRALPLRDANGRILRWLGTCTDIDALKTAEEERDLLVRELSHRIMNIFTMVTSLLSMSARNDPAAQDFAARAIARIDALARANSFVRPAAGCEIAGPRTLRGLLDTLLCAYDAAGDGDARGRIAILGQDLAIGVQTATSLALVLHELATNAMKYGALSAADGRLEIALDRDATMASLVWRERGGPPVAGPPAHTGFGTTLSLRAIRMQLGATIRQDWAAEGLQVTIQLPLERLAL